MTDSAALINEGISTPVDTVTVTTGYGAGVKRQRIQTVGQDEYVSTTASAASLAAGLVTLINARAQSGVVRRGYRLSWTGDVALTINFNTDTGSGGNGAITDCSIVLPPGNSNTVRFEIGPEGFATTQGNSLVAVATGARSLLQMPAQTLTVTGRAIGATTGTLALDYTGQWGGAPGVGMVERVELPTGELLSYVAAGTTTSLTAGVDGTWQFGIGGIALEARHIEVQNKSTIPIYLEYDAAATVGAFRLDSGQTLEADRRVTTLHVLAAAALNLNGTADGNVVIKGWR